LAELIIDFVYIDMSFPYLPTQIMYTLTRSCSCASQDGLYVYKTLNHCLMNICTNTLMVW